MYRIKCVLSGEERRCRGGRSSRPRRCWCVSNKGSSLARDDRRACTVLTGHLLCWSKCRLALTLMYTDKAVRVSSEGSERGGGRRWLPHLAYLSDGGNKGLMNHSESGWERCQREIRGVIVTRWGFFLWGCFYLTLMWLSEFSLSFQRFVYVDQWKQ